MAKQKYYVVWEGRVTGVFGSWEECKKVSCWIFFTRTDWVKAQKEVQIPPFQQYRYLGMEDEAWRPERLFDEKNKEEVRLYIERKALKNCPEKCI